MESADFLKYMAEDSGNAAADGNYSIQVLTRALEQWNLKCLPVMSQEAGTAWQAPQRERAFICNLDRHWLTLRRCEIADPNVRPAEPAAGGTSTARSPRAPAHLGSVLSGVPAPAAGRGYGIFVCRGCSPSRAGRDARRRPPARASRLARDSGRRRARRVGHCRGSVRPEPGAGGEQEGDAREGRRSTCVRETGKRERRVLHRRRGRRRGGGARRRRRCAPPSRPT